MAHIDIQPVERPTLLPTGFENIDHRFTEAPKAANYIGFKQFASPSDTKLVSSKRATEVSYGQPIASEFDFWTIATAYYADSYLRTAIDKYVHLVMREGWTIKGKNAQAVEYIKLRLRLLKLTSGITFEQLLTETVANVVLFSNAFLVRVPFKGTNPIPGLKLKLSTGMKGIGGLFPVHPGLMRPVVKDLNGAIQEWQLYIGGSARATFKPEDILHFAFNRTSNTLYGQPFFLPALEDIRTYRQLEWQTVMLINRYLHPLIHVRKGITPDGKWTARTTDDAVVQATEALIRDVTPDGVLVTGPDTDVKVHGVESQALRIEGYLSSWRNRIFAGLNTSAIAMGEAGAGTRATADAITVEMQDTGKGFQHTVAGPINAYIVEQFLLEGGFDPYVNEDEAHFEFNPISLDERMKRENATIQLWLNNLLGEDEAREEIGRQPMDDTTRATTYGNQYGAPDPGQVADNDNKVAPAGRQGKKPSPGGKAAK